MSKVKALLASHIIKEHFGEIVNKVSSYLLQNGCRCLRDICQAVNLSREEVKKSLCILVHHGLVTYTKTKSGLTEYHLELHSILRRKRYQKYVYCTKHKFGDIAELVVETLLLNGCDTLSHVTKHVSERLEVDESEGNATDSSLVIQKCKELITAEFLTRVKNPNLVEEQEKDDELKELFVVPQGIGVKRKLSSTDGASSSKKRKTDSDDNALEYEDDGIYWHVNFERLDQVFVDQMILNAVSERLDQSASKIVGTMLKITEMERNLMSPATRSISIFEICKKLPSIPNLEQQEVHQYLSLLSDEKTGGFVSKTDEASGGMYSVNLQNCIEMLCSSACSTIVQERFGSKACRVFRLLLQKKHLEQKQIGELAMIPFKEVKELLYRLFEERFLKIQIGELAMIPFKEVKELLYRLFEERFLKIQEVSKAADYAPSRTFYLFAVDLPQIARLLINRCYQAIGNLMIRRESEMDEHKRLLEKNEKIEGILSALSTTNEDTEQVMQELEELITPTEKQQLEKLKIDLAREKVLYKTLTSKIRLEQGEIQVEETVFTLQNYIRFH